MSSYLLILAKEWKISDKIAAVVSDNAMNMTNAVKLCKWWSIPCFQHTLNLTVQNAFEDNVIKQTIIKVKGKKWPIIFQLKSSISLIQ